jgi:hypothetical protein
LSQRAGLVAATLRFSFKEYFAVFETLLNSPASKSNRAFQKNRTQLRNWAS